MGLFDKIKNMFTEEEEYEEEEKEPIKKEVFQVEIPAPKIEEKKEEEEEEPKKEEKFVFPVYFDDSDFIEDEPPRKPVEKPAYGQPYGAQRPRREEYDRRPQVPEKKEEPKKKFKLSPVISPVYGILDKNYKKEDIIEKKTEPEDYFGYKGDTALRVDKVRKKAFGTLEDDLESTLSHVDIDDYKEVEQVVTKEAKEELEKEAVEGPVLEDMFFDSDMTLEDAINEYDSRNKVKEETEDIEETEEVNEKKDDLIESDLFNLIDSMYDKEPKEEE
jgi:hypothetical protein